MFRPNGNLSVWQEWKINVQFRMGTEISHSKLCIYLPLLLTWWWALGPKHVDNSKLIAVFIWICCRSCCLKHNGMNRLKVMHADTSEDLGSKCFFFCLFIICHCRYSHLYLHAYYSVPLVPQCKYLFKLVTATIMYFILVHTAYSCLCKVSL